MPRPAATTLVWLFLCLVLVFLYAPLVPPAVLSLTEGATAGPLAHYLAIGGDPLLVGAIWNSLGVGALVAVFAPLIALVAAEAVRVWGRPRLVVSLLLVPLFIPGVSMGLSTALFFRQLGIDPSLLTITVAQVLWALPFAFLIILTTLANFDVVYLEAAYMSGAGRLRAFFEVELPLIKQGLAGAAVFSLIISFNETIRTALVQGGENTVQTYIWSKYQQVGLEPRLYALMTLLIGVTLVLVALLAVIDARRRRQQLA